MGPDEHPGSDAVPSDSVSAAYPLPPGFMSAKHISELYQDFVSVQGHERIQEADGMQVDTERPLSTTWNTRFGFTARNTGVGHRPDATKWKQQPIVFGVEDAVAFSQQSIDPRHPATPWGTQVPQPKSFLHDTGGNHMTPTGDFAHNDTQQKDDAYDLDEM